MYGIVVTICLPLLTGIMLDKCLIFLSFVVINLSIVYIIVVMPTDSLTLYIYGPSREGVNQEANNVTSTEYQNVIQLVTTNLNLSMYFKAVCHRNVW